jgi:hypothetical protein
MGIPDIPGAGGFVGSAPKVRNDFLRNGSIKKPPLAGRLLRP